MAQLMPQLYQDLVLICSENDGFYYKDILLDTTKYRVFNYRLCSYTSLHSLPSALNCRGVMFNITDPNNVKLVSLPPQKFFNYEEGNGREEHTHGHLGDQMDKMDGSLISTFLHFDTQNQPTVRLKSKASVTSLQASEAMQLLKGPFKEEIERLVHMGYTINMEYTSPTNRIVLYYPEPRLTVLSIRSHLTGETIFARHLVPFLHEHKFESILEQIVPFKPIPRYISHKDLLESIYEQTEGEGYVIEIIRPDQSSYLVKIKTRKYLRIHHCKDRLNSMKNLFEAVINEQTDDLRTLFQDDAAALEQIAKVENEVQPKFNHMVRLVEQFYEENRALSRKDYAILATKTSSMTKYMPLLMNLYSGKVPDYKQFAILHAKDHFGINDSPQISPQADSED